MSPKAIQIGKTYRNKGAGTTHRKVIDMGPHIEAPWFSPNSKPNSSVVKYQQTTGRNEISERTLFLESFASWAGSEVEGV